MSRVDSLKEQGNAYFKNKDYVKAIQYYKEGLELNPVNCILNNNIAQAYLLNKNYSEAETHAVVTVALQESSVKGYYRAAKAAYNLNKTDRALLYACKGLTVFPASEDLRNLLDQLRKVKPDLTNGFPEESGEKASEGKKKSSSEDNSKKGRSRSSSSPRMPSRNSSKKADITSKRSTSSSRSDKVINETKGKRKTKSNRGPIEIEDIQNDKMLKTVESLLEEQRISKSAVSIPEKDSFENIRMDLCSCMKDGSEALEKGLSRKASEKYKSAVDIIITHNFFVFGMKEIDCVILRYSLSISYIETANYSDIIRSLEYLGDIEEKHSAKLPAVYYALGNAYYKLNRFRVALDHLDKGVKVIEKGLKITTHPWPGTMDIIKETTRSGLQESLEALIHHCKTYREPDAVCRYKKCLEISAHIIPSEFIFYSDPDYIGYVVIICEENCKITYHIQCWKAFKESLSPVAKLSDKEMLGRLCLTSDCVNEANEPSVIVKIEIYGDDGNIKSSCSEKPNRANINITKENKKEKKKKGDKTIESITRIKAKTKRKKGKKNNSESSITTPSKEVQSTIISDKLKKQKMDHLRETNFGFAPETTFSPDAEYFGRSDLASLQNHLTPEYVGETVELRNKKEFVFTYFFEYINGEGPQKIKDIEEKWKEEVSQFHGVNEFMSEKEGICNFLLQSYRFATLDDYLCVASQLPDAHDLVKSELSEGLLFRLGNKSNFVSSFSEVGSSNSPEDSPIPANQDVSSGETSSSFPVETILEDIDDIEQEDPITKIDKSSDQMYYSDEVDSSDSESDEDEEDEEEEDDDEEDDNDQEEEVSKNDANLHPSADEFLPPVGQTIEVEKSCDNLLKIGDGDINYMDNGKDKFSECLVNGCQEPSADQPEILQSSHLDTVEGLVPVATEVPAPAPSPPPPTPTPPPPPVEVSESGTQTEPGRDFEKEIEKLSVDVKNLHATLQAQAKNNEILQEKYVKESEKFQLTVKAYDEKIIALENERIKEIKNLQSEISKKDTKMDTMKKKYTDQIDKLNKKVDEDGAAYKGMESKLKDLTQTVVKLTTKLEEEQQHRKQTQVLLLDAKKALAEYKVNIYLEKCAEKLKKMKSMLKYLNDSSVPSLSDVKEAIRKWEGVQKQAEMISAQFQIQYAVSSEQLHSTGSLNESKEFAVTDLPSEPESPLESMETMIHAALERKLAVSPVLKEPSIPDGSHVNTVPPDARSSPHTVMSNSHTYPHQVQGQNLFMANNSVPYRIGNYHTSAFGVAPFPVRMPTGSVMPTPLLGSVPLTGYAANGMTFPEQDTKFFKNVDTSNSFKSRPAEIKTKMEQLQKPVMSKPESGDVPVVPKTVDRKKLSSIAGLTPIETKAPSVENLKKPIPSYKPHPVPSAELKSNAVPSQKMWRYQKLLAALKESFQTEDEDELAVCLAIARNKNNNSLSGLTVPAIYELVAKILKERSEKMISNGLMAMDKFGGCPWGGAKESTFDWNKPAEDVEDCIICDIQMTSDVTPLQCKHTFHTECIRRWLKTNSTCPMCRRYTTLNDEFPPLA